MAYEWDPNNYGEFAVCRHEIRYTPLVVNFQVDTSLPGGLKAAEEGIDYSSLGGTSVRIDAYQPCVPIFVVVPAVPTSMNDKEQEGPEYVQVTLVTLKPGDGYTIGNQPTARVGIADDDVARPTVTISSEGDPTAAEPSDPATFTVTRIYPWNLALDVFFTVSGTATVPPGTPADVQQAVQVPVRIPANTSGATSVDITIRPVPDTIREGTETVVVALEERATYQLGSPPIAVVKILDDETAVPPDITISAIDPDAAETKPGEDPETGLFEIARSAAGTPLTVSYVVRNDPGDATPDSDYHRLGSISFAETELTTQITVTPIDDSVAEKREPVVVTLTQGPGYNVGTPSSATVDIYDNDCRGGVQVRRLSANADPLALTEGQRVLFTATTQPRNPPYGGFGSYTWMFRELLSMSGRVRHYGPWQPAVPTRPGEHRQLFPTKVYKSGQYRVKITSCEVTEAILSVQVIPEISISDAPRVDAPRVGEGNYATTDAVFLVSLSHPTPLPVTVRYRTTNDTATAPSDFFARSGTLSFPPRATSHCESGDHSR